MTASINMNLAPSPAMWSAVVPPGGDLLAEDGAQLLNEDGTDLERE